MPSWIGWIIAFVKGLLGVKADIARQTAEETGEMRQALRDEGAANAVENAAVDAVVAADATRLQSDTAVNTDPASAVNRQPGLELG